jgi:exosome complex exonuclease DIS3/RRP44
MITLRTEGCSITTLVRRHLPPPRTNFEKLQDILLKRKGMKLDIKSSKALADSLDRCIVRHD